MKIITLASIVLIAGLPALAQMNPMQRDLYRATYPVAPRAYQPIDSQPVNAPVQYDTYTNYGSGYGTIDGGGHHYSTYTNYGSGYGNISGE